MAHHPHPPFPYPVLIQTAQDIGKFINRPKQPEHDLPPFQPRNPLEEALRRAALEPARGTESLYQALLVERLYVPISPLEGNDLADLRAQRAHFATAGRHDRTLPLFSSPWRPYDGMPVWPLRQWALPLTGVQGLSSLDDLRGISFVLNPFSRYSRPLPAREAADLLAGKLGSLPTSSGDRDSHAIRALPSLPPGFADALRAYCRTQPSIISAYAAEWDVPPGHPGEGVVILLVSFNAMQLRLHGAVPVAQYFQRSGKKSVSFQPLDPVPAPGYNGEETLHRQLRFMHPLYLVGGAPRTPLAGPLKGVTD